MEQACDCKRLWLWIRFRLVVALTNATQRAMPTEFDGKWDVKCLDTTLPLPTVLHAGYSVKLKKKLNVPKDKKC